VRFGAFGVGSVAGLATRPVSGAGGLAGPAVPVQYKGAKGHPIRAAVARGHWTTVPKRSVCQCSGIQLKAEQRLHSPAHRRRRDSERQETWWLEHWQRESAQGLRARLRRWNLQRRVLHVPLQCSRRDRAGSAPEARASANMPGGRGSGMRLRGSHHRHELQARPLEHAGCFETHWPASAKQAPESVAPNDGKQGDT
jgi:hypothetical protein